MEKRPYNIFFHLHTVSGIVISVGLFIIFFAGAFTLFEHAIHHWEEKKHSQEQTDMVEPLNVDKFLKVLRSQGYNLYGRYVYINSNDDKEENVSIYLAGSNDSLASENDKKEKRLTLNKKNYKISETGDSGFSLGSILYDLHFYYQLGRPGYYLSGAVALFFLFAIITGIIIHWDKLVSNFFVFRPWEKWKTIWTDSHTALGTIGIPFQFMYALTGAMFGLGILVALSASLLYGGDKEEYYHELYGEHDDRLGKHMDVSSISLNQYIDSASARYKGFKPGSVSISNLESSTMQFSVYGNIDVKTKFFNSGEVVYDVMTGKVIHEHNPFEVPYSEGVWSSVYKLHFADYGDLGTLGNYLLRMLYFIMAILTCFVIISGVMIWLKARDKKSVPEKERKYNSKVGYIYLSICLTMLPITAFSFIVSKLLPETLGEHREVILNSFFFGGWLVLSVAFYFIKDNYRINQYSLLSGAFFGLCIPLVSGIYSGNWLWMTLFNKQYDIFVIDALWLLLSIISFYSIVRMNKVRTRQHSANS